MNLVAIYTVYRSITTNLENSNILNLNSFKNDFDKERKKNLKTRKENIHHS